MVIFISLIITILSFFGMFWLHNILDGIIENVKNVWFKIFWILVSFVVMFLGFSWCLGWIAVLIDLIL